MSIWDSLDRNRFYHRLETLCKCKRDKYQRDPTYRGRLPGLTLTGEGSARGALLLPAGIERQLADDFAFLASWSAQPRHVSAAAVRCSGEPGTVTCVVVAANEGMEGRVVVAFEAVLDVLRRRARGELCRADAERSCLSAVVELHRDRIFGRLGSVKTSRKARGQYPSKVDVGERLAAMAGQLKGRVRKRQPSVQPAPDEMFDQLRNMVASIEAAEGAAPGSAEEINALQGVVACAYDLVTRGDGSLPQRLARRGILPASPEPSRVLRELNALANYQRICIDLAQMSGGQYKDCFPSIQLNAIDAPTQPRWAAHQLYVHAEVQILAHFEAHETENRPRFIGASKKPCFLCYSFIRAHGLYSIGGSHGEVFLQWTVPDAPQLSAPSRTRLAAALQRTDQDVERAVKSSRKAKAKRPRLYLQPLQTVSKLLINMSHSSAGSRPIAAGSVPVSVVASSSRPGANLAAIDLSSPPPSDLHCASPTHGAETSAPDSSPDLEPAFRATLTPCPTSSSTALVDSNTTPTFSRSISPQSPAEFTTQDLELHLYLEDDQDPDAPDAKSRRGDSYNPGRAHCQITHLPACAEVKLENVAVVHVEDLVHDKATLRKSLSDEILRFVLEPGSRERRYLVELSWEALKTFP